MDMKLESLSDRLNPVLIKELRQSFRNRMMISLPGILLALQFFMVLIFYLSREDWMDKAEGGGKTFLYIDAALMYICIFCVCAWGAMQRFGEERASAELDFSGITLLTPFQLIGGKLAGSMVTAFLIGSLCLPFMTVAYFFRNVTPLDTAGIFIAGIVPVLISVQAALFCGVLSKKWGHALFLIFVLQVAGPLFIGSQVLFQDELLGGGRAAGLFWLLQAGGFVLFLLLFVSTAALVTPPFANRMFLPRLLGMVCFLVFAGIALLPLFKLRVTRGEPFEAFLGCGPVALTGFLVLLAVCDRDEPGARVLSKAPRNFPGRLCHFLLSSNRTGGVLCCLLVLALLSGCVLLVLPVGGPVVTTTLAISAGLCGYMVFYGELAVLMHRLVPKVPGWVWLLIVTACLGVVSLTVIDGRRVHLEDVFISFVQLFGRIKRSSQPEFGVWYGVLLSGISGIWFLAEGIRKFRSWKAPEKIAPKRE